MAIYFHVSNKYVDFSYSLLIPCLAVRKIFGLILRDFMELGEEVVIVIIGLIMCI